MSLDKAGEIPPYGDMDQIIPSADMIRNALIARAEAFAKRRNTSLSAMSKEAVNDSKFLAEVRNGRNFTIDLYKRMNEWLDRAEREAA